MTETASASQVITRKSASNLALAFILLPKPKREAMCVLYAFCREIDDVADEDSVPVLERARLLQAWREDLRKAFTGSTPEFPVNRELGPVTRNHGLTFELFDELIKGVEMDLEITRYDTWEQLDLYCYRVASVVGLLSIRVFGHQNSKCNAYAIELGKALQLTNILRDVKNDAERKRIYLPKTEMDRFGVTEADIFAGRFTNAYEQLANSVAAQARAHYAAARAILPPEDRKAMASAELMGSVYWGLLQKLEAKRFNVFVESKTRLTKPHKAFLILRTWFRIWRGGMSANYGT